jgi:hypothetical protein
MRLWDLAAEDLLQPALVFGNLNDTARNNFVTAIVSNGRWLAARRQDGTGELWPLALDLLIEQTQYAAGRNLDNSPEEWKLHFPGVPYRKTFPNLPAGRGLATHTN